MDLEKLLLSNTFIKTILWLFGSAGVIIGIIDFYIIKITYSNSSILLTYAGSVIGILNISMPFILYKIYNSNNNPGGVK